MSLVFVYINIVIDNIYLLLYNPDNVFSNQFLASETVIRNRNPKKEFTVRHIIDCDADPLLLKGWEVESHKIGGQAKLNLAKIHLYLSANQQNGRRIQGYELRKKMANESVLNANALDYLLKHPELIPEEWKGKRVHFWGTIYRYSVGHLSVRYLCWIGNRWYWDWNWLDYNWADHDPAACSQAA